MACALHRPLCGALVALALLGSSARAQTAGVPDVVEKLLQGFSSPDCLRRWQAIEEYTDRMIGRVLSYTEPVAEVTDGLRELGPAKGPAVEPKVRVVPELLRGLDADSFAARYESTRALLVVSKQPIERYCVDPSDRAPDRVGGVQAWQTWWEQSKARLAVETIEQ